jgi:hypothetical protein
MRSGERKYRIGERILESALFATDVKERLRCLFVTTYPGKTMENHPGTTRGRVLYEPRQMLILVMMRLQQSLPCR